MFTRVKDKLKRREQKMIIFNPDFKNGYVKMVNFIFILF